MSEPQPLPRPASDAELMARVRAGDREAFAELIDRHKDALVGYLARLTGCPERAQDLAQETFLRLYETRGRYQERGLLSALLYRIATNLVRSEARRERRRRLFAPHLARLGFAGGVPVDDRSATAAAGPDRVRRRDLQRRLAQALARLPLALRAPLVLYEIEDWSQGEIARALGCPEGTIKSRLFRARRRLREELADCQGLWHEGGST